MANTVNGRRRLQGVVVSTKMNKTVTVEVKTYVPHPKYGKRVLHRNKFKAHDENEICKVGDEVAIVETRPLSKTKHFRVYAIIKKGE